MILSLIRFFEGGISYECFKNMTIPQILNIHKYAVRLHEEDKREIERGKNG